MSESLRTAPAPATEAKPTEVGQEPNPKAIAVEQDGANLENALERGPNTPEEAVAKNTLGKSKELTAETTEQATWRVRALNTMDRAQSKITMQGARQARYEGRIARLERKLVGVKPGSRKANRLGYKLNVAKYRRGIIESKRENVFGRMHERSKGYSEEVKRVADIEKARNEKLMKKKVAIEAKRRRKLTKEYALELKQTDPNRRQQVRHELFSDKHKRERLRKEIASWRGNGMDKFKKELEKEINAKHKNRIDQGVL